MAKAAISSFANMREYIDTWSISSWNQSPVGRVFILTVKLKWVSIWLPKNKLNNHSSGVQTASWGYFSKVVVVK